MNTYAVLPKLDRPNAINFSTAFDRYVQIVSFAVHNKRRIDSKSASKLTNVCLRSAQRYLIQLEEKGYLVGDKETPQGFIPTDKAKQLFGVSTEVIER